MSKLKLNITMSLDGFVAGPDQSPERPLGVGGENLHGWLYPLKAFREGHGEEGGEVNASTPFAEDILGGADVVQQALDAGAVDELHLHLAPLLLGDGVRLFGAGRPELELAEVVDSPHAAHLTYRVVN